MADPLSIVGLAGSTAAAAARTYMIVQAFIDAVDEIDDNLRRMTIELTTIQGSINRIASLFQIEAFVAAAKAVSEEYQNQIWENLSTILQNCTVTLVRLETILQDLKGSNQQSFLRRGLRVLQLGDRRDDILGLRLQIQTYNGALQTSLQGFQLCVQLQSNARGVESSRELKFSVQSLTQKLESQKGEILELKSMIAQRSAKSAANADESLSIENLQKLLRDFESIQDSTDRLRYEASIVADQRSSAAGSERDATYSAAFSVRGMPLSTRKREELFQWRSEIVGEDTEERIDPHPMPAVSKVTSAPSSSSPMANLNPTLSTPDQPSHDRSRSRDSSTQLEDGGTPEGQNFPHGLLTPSPIAQSAERKLSNSGSNQLSTLTEDTMSFENFEQYMSQMAARAEGQKKSPFSDDDFIRISDHLRSLGKPAWADRPRTYLVLRLIDQVHIMNNFVFEGLKDIAIPYSEEQIPAALSSPESRHAFLQRQSMVLVSDKAKDIITKERRHRHLNKDADVYFKHVKTLGDGGFGTVDHVISRFTLEAYARKRIHRSRAFARNKDEVRLFEKELDALKKLSHRHLVKFIGSYSDPKYIGLIISPVADCDLRSYLSKVPFPDEDISILRSFFACLCSAIKYLHDQKVRHKDIKPGNILIKDSVIYVTDFGTSLDWSDRQSDITAGRPEPFTPEYAAPEVLYQQERNSSSDVWSMGCVFLEITTVLKRETPTSRKEFFKQSAATSETPQDRAVVLYANRRAISGWISTLEGRSQFDTKPLEWVRRMTEWNPVDRISASVLMSEILSYKGENVYYAACCNLEDSEDEREHSSYKGSDSEEEIEKTPRSMTRGTTVSADGPITPRTTTSDVAGSRPSLSQNDEAQQTMDFHLPPFSWEEGTPIAATRTPFTSPADMKPLPFTSQGTTNVSVIPPSVKIDSIVQAPVLHGLGINTTQQRDVSQGTRTENLSVPKFTGLERTRSSPTTLPKHRGRPTSETVKRSISNASNISNSDGTATPEQRPARIDRPTEPRIMEPGFHESSLLSTMKSVPTKMNSKTSMTNDEPVLKPVPPQRRCVYNAAKDPIQVLEKHPAATANGQRSRTQNTEQLLPRLGFAELEGRELPATASMRWQSVKEFEAYLEKLRKTSMENWQRSLRAMAAVTEVDSAKNTPLHFAVRLTDPQLTGDVVNNFLSYGINANVANIYSETPLHDAIKTGRTAIIRSLLAHGADIDRRTLRGHNALHCAVVTSQLQTVQLILKHISPRTIDAEANHRKTPLHLACQQDESDIVSLLLSKGARPDLQDSSGRTPEACARIRNSAKVLELFARLYPRSPSPVNGPSASPVPGQTPPPSPRTTSTAEKPPTTAQQIPLPLAIQHVSPVPGMRPSLGSIQTTAQQLNDSKVMELEGSVPDFYHTTSCECMRCHLQREKSPTTGSAPAVGKVTFAGLSSYRQQLASQSAGEESKSHRRLLSLQSVHEMSHDRAEKDFAEATIRSEEDLSLGPLPRSEFKPLETMPPERHNLPVPRLRQSFTRNAENSLAGAGFHGENSYKKIPDVAIVWAMENICLISPMDEILSLLLDAGANIETVNEHGQTVLHLAARHSLVHVIPTLLRRGASANQKDGKGLTPLHHAVLAECFEACKLLLDHGVDIEAEADRGFRPFSYALVHSSRAVVKVLIERGANIQAIPEGWVSPLLFAAKTEKSHIVDLLLETDAIKDINKFDSDHVTTLHIIAKTGSEFLIRRHAQALAKHIVDIDPQDRRGYTPLHFAVEADNQDAVKALRMLGANPNASNREGITPLAMAQEKRDKQMIELLGGKMKRSLFGTLRSKPSRLEPPSPAVGKDNSPSPYV